LRKHFAQPVSKGARPIQGAARSSPEQGAWHRVGASLRDVQLLAGHQAIQTTQRYIDGDTDAQRKLVSLI